MGAGQRTHIVTSFENNEVHMFRRDSANNSFSPHLIEVYNAGADARGAGDWVLRFKPTTGGLLDANGVQITFPTYHALGVSVAHREPVGTDDHDILNFYDSSGLLVGKIRYNSSTGYTFLVGVGSTSRYFEIIIRESNGTLLSGPHWVWGSSLGGSTVLDTGIVSADTWYLIQIRAFSRVSGWNKLLFGCSGGESYTDEWWLDDLLISAGSLPLPANPVFGVLPASAVVGGDFTSPGDEVTSIQTMNKDTSYITSSTFQHRQLYKHAASGLGAVNILGVTCWLVERGTVLSQANCVGYFLGCWAYSTPCVLDENIVAGDLSFDVTGGPPAISDIIRIGDELMTVSAVTGGGPIYTITVTRGTYGTTAASHTDGDRVLKVVEDYNQLYIPPTNESYGSLIRINAGENSTDLVNLGTTSASVEEQLVPGHMIRVDNEKAEVATIGSNEFSVVSRGADGTTAEAWEATDEVKYQDYFGTYSTLYRNPIDREGLTVTNLDDLLWGAFKLGTSTTRITAAILEYVTATEPEDDFKASRVGVTP